MSNYTDRFILGWMNVTFQNQPKDPPSFAPFEYEIGCYQNQIYMHFIASPSTHNINPDHIAGIWEAHSKDRLLDALPAVGATPNDLLFLADTDEYPTFEAMETLLTKYQFTGIQRIRSTQFYYNFRSEQRVEYPWIAPILVYWKDLHEKPSRLRKYGDTITPTNPDFHAIHISFAFPALEGVRQKIIWALKGYSKPPYTTYEHIFAHVACMIDLFDRKKLIDRQNEFARYIPQLSDSRLDHLKHDFDAAFDDLHKIDIDLLAKTPNACPNIMDLYKVAKSALDKRKQSPRFVNHSFLYKN